MSFYTEEHLLFQSSVKRFSEKHILPHLTKWEKDHHFPSEIFLEFGKEGFLGILVGEKWGGVQGDYKLAAAWCEQFGRIPSVGFTTAVNMHSLVITPTVERFASEATKEQWLPQAVEGKVIGAYAFTEPNAGSDLTNMNTKAVKDGDNYILTGSKIFITNGARANFVLVVAKTDSASNPKGSHGGFSTFLVDTSSEGFSVARKLEKLGWHCSDTAELVLEGVKVHKSCLLGAEGQGWQQAMASLQWERLMLSLGALAGAKECFEKTIQYINERTIFGKTVGSFDYSRELVAQIWSKLTAAEASCHNCLLMLQRGEDCRVEVSLTKHFVCELAIWIADKCLQFHGGYGYTQEFLPERWLRDLRLNTIGGGTSEVMLQIAAKGSVAKLASN
jgi:alkylation response protein AidB-like acyl-CoA dehydrogenase